MKHWIFLLTFVGCICCAGQESPRLDYNSYGSPLLVPRPDPVIAGVLREVSAAKIRTNVERLVKFNNRSTISSTETDLKPGTGVTAAADWIREQFEAYSRDCKGCLEVKVDAFTELPEAQSLRAPKRIARPTPITNVYAILRGSDPSAGRRIVLVTGHYDTRETDVMETHRFAPGANDDSSGTAVVLEASRVLSHHRLPATVVFVAVAGEEQGLNGSRHLAQLAKDQGWRIEAVLSNDIVGGDTTPGDTLQTKSLVRVFSQGIQPSAPVEQLRRLLALGLENDSASRQLAREVLEVGRTYHGELGSEFVQPVMELRLDRYLRGGDHKSFSDAGFAAVRFTEWRENFDHQHQRVRKDGDITYGDLPEFVDWIYVARVARLNIATLATLALAPGPPTDVGMVTSNLDNSTGLTWSGAEDPTNLDHYEVVWRETAANDWQFGIAVTAKPQPGSDRLSTILPISKDNVFFGVRACDGHHHCSSAVAPVPESLLHSGTGTQ